MQKGSVLLADSATMRKRDQSEKRKEVIEHHIRVLLLLLFSSLSLPTPIRTDFSFILSVNEVRAERGREEVEGSGEELESREDLCEKTCFG